MSIYPAFVYRWFNHQRNMYYIGVHKGTPDDGYICSSKYMKEDYQKNPEHFIREIVAEGEYKEMLELELIKVLNDNISFLFNLNQSNNNT